MTSQIPENQIESLKKLLQRPMKIHWVMLPSEAASSLITLFSSHSNHEISSLLESELDLVNQLRSEKHEIDEIVKNVEQEKERVNAGDGQHVSYTDIRHKIVGMLYLLPLNKLSKLLGIPRSTLATWRLQEKKKINNRPKAVVKQSIQKSEATSSYARIESIEHSLDLEELHQMIKRHKGKTHKKYSKSERELILKLVDRFGSKLVHLHTKVSYDTIARLLRQRERGCIVPSTKGRYLPVIETMRKYPGMGPMQIRDYVHRHHGLSMGVNSVRKAMEDNGWVASYSRRVVVEEEERSYEAVRRNYLWHLDFKHFYINKCKVYLLFIEDDFSRFIVGDTLSDAERVDVVIDCLSECIHRHGKPEMIMSDGGSAFYSWRGISKLTRFLEDFGIDQKIARIPRVNGKIESINQKIEKELLNIQSFSSLNHLEGELAQWIGVYNFKRPHQGLSKLQVPADRYYPGADKWFKENDKGTEKVLFESMATLFRELQKK